MLYASVAREITVDAIVTMLENHVKHACAAMESTVTVDLPKIVDDALVPLVIERMDRRGYYASTWVVGIEPINRIRLTWNKPKLNPRKSNVRNGHAKEKDS